MNHGNRALLSSGCHWLTLVPPYPVEAMPMGTLYLAAIASPNAGHGLPPLLLSWVPACGSSARRQKWPLKLETMPEVCLVGNWPELVEFDCPAMTKTSPTPTLSIVIGSATGLPPLLARTSTLYHPPAGSWTLPK